MLLEPLSRELGISLNELLAGEKIEKEKAIEYSEQNLISTIDYTEKKIKNVHREISMFIMGAGILMCIRSFTVFPSESSWGEIYSVLGTCSDYCRRLQRIKEDLFIKKRTGFHMLISYDSGNFFLCGLYWGDTV